MTDWRLTPRDWPQGFGTSVREAGGTDLIRQQIFNTYAQQPGNVAPLYSPQDMHNRGNEMGDSIEQSGLSAEDLLAILNRLQKRPGDIDKSGWARNDLIDALVYRAPWRLGDIRAF